MKITPFPEPINFHEKTVVEEVKNQQKRRNWMNFMKIIEKSEKHEESITHTMDSSTESDAVIAQLLQNQYYKEYDLMLKRMEEKFNKYSKVGISYAKYRVSPTIDTEDAKSPNVDDDNRDLDRFVDVEKQYASIPKCGYKKNSKGSEIVTKHDMLISSRINACRVLEFPPGISTGDTGGFDVKLNNRVFNTLKAHSHAYCAREKAKTRSHHK